MGNTEDKIKEEIIRRALERSDTKLKERQNLLDEESLLESLQEITDLPRDELEAIARDVRASFPSSEKGYFSIKNQVFIACIVMLLAIGLVMLIR